MIHPIKNATVNFPSFFNKEEDEIVFYPYETTRFTKGILIEMDRHDCAELEEWLLAHATKKYDGWGTRKYIPINGAKQDNKSTLTFRGLAFHFHDWEVWIASESTMEIGRF